ncbi:MAG: MBL fold metallo-hydrolase RNA specificity domain-containing protein [Acidobacteriota bacterium]
MYLSFHGAAREVTGSCHLLEANGSQILLDCGLYQGGKERHSRNREPFSFSPKALDHVILSHAHIDHCGRLPLLLQAGYQRRIFCTAATASLCEILLRDSGHIQEEDARWKIKRLKRLGEDYSWVRPLYTAEQALAALERLDPVPFGETFELGDKAQARFVEAGHILGAAIVELTVEQKRPARIVFSGDLGVDDARLLGPPQPVACPDYLIMESTYGDRVRGNSGDRTELLLEIVSDTLDRGGKVIIPSFAIGRTQEILARLNDLVEGGRLHGVPVYVDSPMAVKATSVFSMHPECYSEEARSLLKVGDKPLQFDGLKLIDSVEASKAINHEKEPSIIISASGMCDGGRIKHHLKYNIEDPRSTILFVGYQANRSLGHAIQSGRSAVRIYGDEYEVRARVVSIHGFSAHADLHGLKEWFRALGDVPRQTFVVHGEEDVALGFASTLEDEFRASACAPRRGDRTELN